MTWACGFISRPGLRWEQETQKSLKEQPPEKATGSFDPVLVYLLLRSGSAYSLPYDQPEVYSGRASRVPFAGRSKSDTTPMHDTRRSAATDSPESIKNQSHVHPVHPGKIGVDTEKRHTAPRLSDCVQASTPKCNVRTELKRESRSLPVSKYKGYVDWGGHLDADVRPAATSCGSLCPPPSPKGGLGGHNSGGVTL